MTTGGPYEYETTDASKPQAQIVIPPTASSFGSRAQFSDCVVCGESFTREEKVVWRQEALRYAHYEHFEEPIPEPPGKTKIVIDGVEL